jgi:glycosyltransferase involved in cell wall biosynthesis
LRPGVVAAFDEVGTWARLLPAVAARHGVLSLDLPHAEAVDPVAIQGAAYDRMAVYGSRSAAVLRRAGIPDGRIVEIGAPRFDRLASRSADLAGSPEPSRLRRIVFAAQYETGSLTREVLAGCLRGAMAAAAAVAPSELVIVPHPAAPPDATWAITPERVWPDVVVTTADRHALHDVLPGAWAMVTGWSNSVFEAAIAGVPSITVDPGGIIPRDYAAEGLALRATDEGSAAEVARSLLDDDTRRAAVSRARSALPERIGPIDGQATGRAAAIALEMRSMGRPARRDASGGKFMVE